MMPIKIKLGAKFKNLIAANKVIFFGANISTIAANLIIIIANLCIIVWLK